MDSKINKSQNIGNNKFFFSQAQKNNQNDKNLNINIKFISSNKNKNNLSFSSDFKNQTSQYFPKKRKRPEEEDYEEHPTILNKNEISELLHKNYKLIENEIEKKENRKIKLNEDIQKMQKELKELDDEIDKYKSLNLEIFNILRRDESKHKVKDEIKIIKNNKYEGKKVAQDLDRKQKQFLNIPNNLIPEFNEGTIISNNENQNSNDEPKYINTLDVLKTLGKHKFVKVENTNNHILEGFDQYSFRCLADNLNCKIKEGKKEASIIIELENDGKYPWPNNETFLIVKDEAKSQIKSQKISLSPLNPNEKIPVNIQITLDKLKKGIHKKYLVFNAKNKNF